jgi:uncharacterized protein (DUF427 family)
MPLPCIVRPDGLVLARAQQAEHVIELEDNWYFHPQAINHAVLSVSKRTYICPYKGTCFWVDFRHGSQFTPDTAWVYPAPKPGYRKIAGWYGFYHRGKDYQKADFD